MTFPRLATMVAACSALMLAACASDKILPSTSDAPVNGSAQQQTSDIPEPGAVAVTAPAPTAVMLPPGAEDMTLVGRKVLELGQELTTLQSGISQHEAMLRQSRASGQTAANDYFSNVAAISAKLQNGTTPGNPRLVQQWNQAQSKLDVLAKNVADMNELATKIAGDASLSAFLVESIRATYGISGAVDEDHENLAKLEDEVNTTVVGLNRTLNDLSDDITRQSNYLTSERRNLMTLSLAIANGEMYGTSLANRAFSSVPGMAQPFAAEDPMALAGTSSSAHMMGSKPLMVIRFDKPDVQYEQALYQAMSAALDRASSARFELVAVTPSSGNAAQVAAAVNDTKRNAESVMRTLAQMGLPADRIDMTASTSQEAASSEVQIFVK